MSDEFSDCCKAHSEALDRVAQQLNDIAVALQRLTSKPIRLEANGREIARVINGRDNRR